MDVLAAGRPQLGGYPATDATALVGTVGWLGLVAASTEDVIALGTVDLFVAFAMLALVPLGLGLVRVPTDHRAASLAVRLAVYGQLPGAILAIGGLLTPVGSAQSTLLVLPWLGVTGTIALVGVARLARRRSLLPLPALAVDAALLYVPVGAVALVAHRAGIALPFDPIIVLLTVVHYHYAGFVLPLVVGRAGEYVTTGDGTFGTDPTGRVAAVATVVVILNLVLIAVGITFSPTVEVVAVGLFTVAVAAFAAVVLREVVPVLAGLAGAGLAVASLVLFVTMAFALAYGYSAFPATGTLVSLDQMITWHGTLNAFGFALPALLAFRYIDGRT